MNEPMTREGGSHHDMWAPALSRTLNTAHSAGLLLFPNRHQCTLTPTRASRGWRACIESHVWARLASLPDSQRFVLSLARPPRRQPAHLLARGWVPPSREREGRYMC